MDSLRAVGGIAVLLGLAWLLGERKRVTWRPVVGGLVLQLALAVVLIRLPPAQRAMLVLNHAALALQDATDQGAGFVFGYLGGGALPFIETHPGASFILAFKILPLVLTISALSALLYHWGMLQLVARGFAVLLRRALGVSGPLALGAAVHVYVGMIEAPLMIRPYLLRMSRGELFAIMCCGMAGVAGTVMVLYATLLEHVLPNALGQILSAGIISTPAALVVAGLMVPFGDGTALPHAELTMDDKPAGAFEALVKGTRDGVAPLVGIATVLLVAVALVALANMLLAVLPGGFSLQSIAATLLRPVMWLIGIPWDQAGPAAALMGTKTVLNEFVAYLDLAHLPDGTLDARSRTIVTYALCGFANFGSVGILVGGMGAMIPERRADISALGLRSLLGGTIATCTSGALAGVLS